MTRSVICLDGTWNTAATEKERADGSKVYRPKNLLRYLARRPEPQHQLNDSVKAAISKVRGQQQ